MSAILRIEDLPNGYEVSCNPDRMSASELQELVSYEKRCCAFLDLDLVPESEQRAVVLRVTGREGVKEFLRNALLGEIVPRRTTP